MSAHHGARVVQLSDRRTATTTPPNLRRSLSLDEALARAGVQLQPTPWESVCRLGEALRTFGRELRKWAGIWLSAHRIGYVERANAAGYAAGYCDGLAANPRRTA